MLDKFTAIWFPVCMLEGICEVLKHFCPWAEFWINVIMLAVFSIGLFGWIYATFFNKKINVETKVVESITPLNRFKKFLRNRIEEGEKLFKCDLPDEIKTRLAEESFRGVILAPLDQSEIVPFRDLNVKWKKSVCGGLGIALSDEIRKSFKGPFHSPKLTPSATMFGGFKRYLREDIDFLKTMEGEIKSDWLDKSLVPENLAEYEEPTWGTLLSLPNFCE